MKKILLLGLIVFSSSLRYVQSTQVVSDKSEEKSLVSTEKSKEGGRPVFTPSKA